MSYCFKIALLAETCIKCVIFIEKLQIIARRWGEALASGDWGATIPRSPSNPPLRFPGFATELE